ncbi:hypothetical protein K474DRAFT_339823 [Panus rudis PR-1116 ss-1]|nr:hypothetical protein K474DRAFT_339823 [Panus rudis PR-1116 ss-1]
MASKSKPNPLPFSDTIRDLSLLRASDVDFTSVLTQTTALYRKDPVSSDATLESSDVEQTLQRSYEFVKEARAAVRILNRGDIDTQGARVEDVRSRLEDVLKGLEGQ